MRLAVPVWKDRVSPVLDSATRLLILEVKEGGKWSRSEIDLDEGDPSIRCRRIRSLGVDALICGAVTRHLSNMLRGSGILLVLGVSGPSEEVLHACLEGRLNHSKYLMPGWSLDGLVEQMEALKMERFKSKG
jgi:predicted Fe-Mo cluster-binding NifX family protein